MVAADLVNAVVIATVPLAWWLGLLTVPHVLVVAFAVPGGRGLLRRRELRRAYRCWSGATRIAEANAAVWGAQTLVEIVIPSLVGVGLGDHVARDHAGRRRGELSRLGVLHRAHRSGAARPDPRASAAQMRATCSPTSREGLRFLVGHPGVRTMTVDRHRPMRRRRRLRRLDGRLVRPGARHRHRGTALRAGVCRLERRGADRIAGLPRLLRRASAARIALLALARSAVLGLGAALAPSWQWAAVGLLLVERRLHAGRGQHDLLPAGGHARSTDGTGQHRGPDALVGRRLDARGAPWGACSGMRSGSAGAGRDDRVRLRRGRLCLGITAASLATSVPMDPALDATSSLADVSVAAGARPISPVRAQHSARPHRLTNAR